MMVSSIQAEAITASSQKIENPGGLSGVLRSNRAVDLKDSLAPEPRTAHRIPECNWN